MGLDVWFKDDVTRILRAFGNASFRYDDLQFKMGYIAAIADLATAFGVEPEVKRLIVEDNFDYPRGRGDRCPQTMSRTAL